MCLRENPTIFYNLHNLLENFCLVALAKFSDVSPWVTELVEILGNIYANSNENTYNEILSGYVLNYRVFLEILKLNLVRNDGTLVNDTEAGLAEDFDQICKNSA